LNGDEMMKVKFAPSIMCSDLSQLGLTVKELEKANVDMIHIDIMDGQYVPNIVLGTDIVNALRDITSLPLDLHFMCKEPERIISMFDPKPGERVTFHPETTYHPHRLLQQLKQRQCIPGLVLSPGQPLEIIEELLPDIEVLQLMAVHPGFPGAKFQWSCLEKAKKFKKMAESQGLNISLSIDGSVGPDNARMIVEAGFDVLILGYAGCFAAEYGIGEMISRMRAICSSAGN